MTEINKHQVEYAVVGRLRHMLASPPETPFNVTQTYALFTATLCWVMQRIRIRSSEIKSDEDKIAAKLFRQLQAQQVTDEPWCIPLSADPRNIKVGEDHVSVPASKNFDTHDAARFLINLRDATAHGDARNVKPFHVPRKGADIILAGFSFNCEEVKGRGKDREVTWSGSITLVEEDLRRIGISLAEAFCICLWRGSDKNRRNNRFGADADHHVREAAA